MRTEAASSRSHEGCWVRDQRTDDRRLVVLENEVLRVGVLPERGAEIVEFLHKPSETDYCWHRPGSADAHAASAGSKDPADSFLDGHTGGWGEVLPNGGPPSDWAGASYGQHGEVGQLPWATQVTQDDPESVSVEFIVRGAQTPLLLRRALTLRTGEERLSVAETLTNPSDVPQRAMWGWHIAFGPPFLAPGTRIVAPKAERAITHPVSAWSEGRRSTDAARFEWPHAPTTNGATVDLSVVPDVGTASEMVYLISVESGRYELVNPRADVPRFRLEWDERVFPHLWIWQEYGASKAYPWNGQAYVLGLEPFSSYPSSGLATAVENGTAMEIQPRSEISLEWTAQVHGGGGWTSELAQ